MEFDGNVENFIGLPVSYLDEEDDEDDMETQNGDVEDDVSDDGDDEEDRLPMTLGFADKPKNQWSLLRQYFPSKAGGAPAWLDPVNLPFAKSSLCDFCGEPLQFLLQVYAPLPEESTFHRSLFVFMCLSMECLRRDRRELWEGHTGIPSRSVKVFRCQLPHENSFYSSNAPIEDGSQQPLTSGAPLCNWCGTWKMEKRCCGCRKACYCSKEHQTDHWKSSVSSHKVSCWQLETTSVEASESAASNSLWPEFEITNEDECEVESDMANDYGSASSLASKKRTNGYLAKLMKDFEGDGDKRCWTSFQERIFLAPEQVLRYSSFANAKPMWPVFSGRPSKLSIPKCNYCGGPRGFEFQVLPQLLYFFRVKNFEDSLDWATIVVYTCEASCDGNVSYKEEFAWVQLAS